MKKITKATSDYIRDLDEIVEPSAASLHFQTDFKQKTFAGGLASFAVTLYVLFFVYQKGSTMFNRDDPNMTSLEEQMSYDDVGKVSTKTTAKVLFEILEGGDNTVDLDAVEGGYHQYIHLRLNNIIKTFDADGNMEKVSKYYPLQRCNEDNFGNTAFEADYYSIKKSRSQYCIDQHEDIYLQGTRDSEVKKEDHAYITFEVFRCSEDTKIDETKPEGGYPECKPERMMKLKSDLTAPSVNYNTIAQADLINYEEDLEADTIDNWLRYKVAAMKIINQKIDFTAFSDYDVRYNEMFVPSIPLAYPSYSDTGYRFRYNAFDRQDGYFIQKPDLDIFYDYFEYNTDTFTSAPEGSEQLVAEMYFRLEVDQITHNRVVYTFMDFIGDLGGVKDIMLQLAGWVIGSYAAFHASWSTVAALYRVKLPEGNIYAQSKQNDPSTPDLYKIKLPLCTRLFLWLNTTMCGFLFKCCLKDHHEKFLEVLDKGAEKQENDFDIYEII